MTKIPSPYDIEGVRKYMNRSKTEILGDKLEQLQAENKRLRDEINLLREKVEEKRE